MRERLQKEFCLPFQTWRIYATTHEQLIVALHFPKAFYNGFVLICLSHVYYVKVMTNFLLVMKQFKINIDASQLTDIGKGDPREEIRDYYPVFYNAFSLSA